MIVPNHLFMSLGVMRIDLVGVTNDFIVTRIFSYIFKCQSLKRCINIFINDLVCTDLQFIFIYNLRFIQILVSSKKQIWHLKIPHGGLNQFYFSALKFRSNGRACGCDCLPCSVNTRKPQIPQISKEEFSSQVA